MKYPIANAVMLGVLAMLAMVGLMATVLVDIGNKLY